MVKSKSEETKDYKILLETCVPLHPQEWVCSSVLLPNRLTLWPWLGVYVFWGGQPKGPGSLQLPQGWRCPLLSCCLPLPTQSPPSAPSQALGGASSAHKTSRKLCFHFGWPREPSWEPMSTRAGAGKAGDEHSQEWGMGSKEQSQSWHSTFSS